MENTRNRTRELANDRAGIAAASAILHAGGLVAFPTETVYGLGADATNGEAVARIYAAKKRPAFNPLIAHVVDLAAAGLLGRFDARAMALARAFWPGPLTLVVPVTPDCPVSLLARAGLDTIAIRVPAHQLARDLLLSFGKPIAAPSANISGTVSPTTARHVLDGLQGRIDAVIDGGRCSVGVESTIVDCSGPSLRILRPGGVPREDIERIAGQTLPRNPNVETESRGADEGVMLAPGMMAAHYAPRTKVRLNVRSPLPGEAVMDFAGQLTSSAVNAAAYADLSTDGNLVEAAASLFSVMRALDEAAAPCIAVAPIPGHSLGEAINDRLKRAATMQ